MEIEVMRERALQLGRREAILRLQDAIISEGRDVGPASCPVKHHFAPGSYGREMTLPAGLVVVGKIHKHAHINVISKGRVQVFTEQEGVLELAAPCTFVSSPGTKRVVHVLEETVWTTVHVTDKTDLAEIEREVIATDFMEVEQ
ncbi:hypothetical protein SnaR1_gp38 [Sphaerotilus phage vB_SnaP-R1]|uniref:Uncharacterized protein n=1 Tax=Sphaerotilus phage vB_SnaP-R1 TaxID=2696336 RepID=A0A6B9SWT0_9CAUD|nr:hypothetical protein SnaR1_gp38 [Sphaerotilus phage vB_SnaP-R1]